jgi:hypothetical protein
MDSSNPGPSRIVWALEYIHICHKSKRELIILKLDFEKAFDKIEHGAILEILRAKDFWQKWISWMSKAGDPLSPLIFVLDADLLQSIVNRAKDQGLLKLPIPLRYTNDFLVIQYADDTLLVMEACSTQLWALKALLHTFGESTGLRVNYAKSFMVPINTSQEKLQPLARTFNCETGSLPFTYLGLPLSPTLSLSQG